MILPNKYLTASESYIGISAFLLEILNDKVLTTDSLWLAFKKKYIKSNKLSNPPNYQKFIYVLEFMYITNMIGYNEIGEISNENIKS